MKHPIKTDDSLTEPIIRAENIGIERGDRWLIRNVDICLNKCEIMTLIGPNGGGKTTIAKALMGLMSCSEGKVSRTKGLKIGYVPQKLSIDWTLPINVKRLMTLTSHASDEEIDTSLERVGIQDLKLQQIQSLSGGEFQRALIARAILRKPDLLVLDEPVQGVDFNGMLSLYELIDQIRYELGCSILLISHDLHIVMAKTDQVICVNGHVCCSGTPQTVVMHDEYQRLFGIQAANTLAVYHHEHDHTHDNSGEIIPISSSTHDKGEKHD